MGDSIVVPNFNKAYRPHCNENIRIVVQGNCNKNQLVFKPIEVPLSIKSHAIYHKFRWVSPVFTIFP